MMTRQTLTRRVRGAGLVAAFFLLVAGLTLAATLAATAPALAAGPGPERGVAAAPTATPEPQPAPLPTVAPEDRRIIQGDQVFSGDNFTLRSDETLKGDLTIFGGNAVLEEGSRMEGNISVFGGNADIYGTVVGNVTMVGGSLHLRSTARIEGYDSILGGSVTRDEGSVVTGKSTRIFPPAVPAPLQPLEPLQGVDRRWPFGYFFDVMGSLFGTLLGVMVAALFAIAVVALFPANVARTAGTVQSQWLVSGGVGVLSLVAVPIVLAVLALTICLIPVTILGIVALLLAAGFGWVVVARMLGERLMGTFNRAGWTPIGQTVLGAVVLALLGAIPILGGLIGFLAASVGLGALVLTRLGTRPYPPPVVVPPAPPAPPQLPESAAQ
jgi:hypothetical protein